MLEWQRAAFGLCHGDRELLRVAHAVVSIAIVGIFLVLSLLRRHPHVLLGHSLLPFLCGSSGGSLLGGCQVLPVIVSGHRRGRAALLSLHHRQHLVLVGFTDRTLGRLALGFHFVNGHGRRLPLLLGRLGRLGHDDGRLLLLLPVILQERGQGHLRRPLLTPASRLGHHLRSKHAAPVAQQRFKRRRLSRRFAPIRHAGEASHRRSRFVHPGARACERGTRRCRPAHRLGRDAGRELGLGLCDCRG